MFSDVRIKSRDLSAFISANVRSDCFKGGYLDFSHLTELKNKRAKMALDRSPEFLR